MNDNSNNSFPVAMEFKHVHKTISEYVYETPLAFLRENVQNALDAVRMQAHVARKSSEGAEFEIALTVSPEECQIRDNGIGMSLEDLRRYFWTIGASGKRTQEARDAGCVGMFGIGGFANFGVCDIVTVISQKEGTETGTSTRLSQEDIDNSTTEFPRVQFDDSTQAAPRGTIVKGHFKQHANVDELHAYISDFVTFARERILFNGAVISQKEAMSPQQRQSLVPLSVEPQAWQYGTIELEARLFRDQAHTTLTAELTKLKVSGVDHRFYGLLRFEGGRIDVFKRGFKLCATTVSTPIGISGRIDCDLMVPTAGRDSLNADSTILIGQIATCIESVAVQAILGSKLLIAQHARVFRYIIANNLISRLGQAEVQLADGTPALLEEIHYKAQNGVGVYFGAHQKEALSQIMQARGNVVVILPSDRYKQQAVQKFLENYCNARAFSGIVEFQDVYRELDRFEQVFLSELEMAIQLDYDVKHCKLTAGKLTEDIPVFLPERKAAGPLEIHVDVRHSEIAKLRRLDFGPLLYSLIGSFCREYLGSALRKQSPKFFGSGALNFDSLEKRRTEMWVLAKDDIHTVSKRSKRHVVTRSDVHTITAGGGGGGSTGADVPPLVAKPKLLNIQGDSEFADIVGYYIRIPDPATRAFGDVIKQYDRRASVWAGNKILFVAADGISSAFQFEIRLDHVIRTTNAGESHALEGAVELAQPVQELAEGLYFPIPSVLEKSLVPDGDDKILIEVSSGDWIDTQTSHQWKAKEA
jgi:molecular chaperone HtpG